MRACDVNLLCYKRLNLYKGLLALLELERYGALVAYFGGAKVLDGARVYEASVLGPFFAVSSELLEGCAVKTNEGFLDYGLHLTVTALHVHHHGDGHTACYPVFCGSCGVLNDGHVAGLSVCNELSSAGTKGIAVVGIVV